jgi:mono/diheme cytochrome c family protein
MKQLLLAASIAAFSLFVAAQATKTDTTSGTKPEINKVAAPRISPSDGKGMYVAYCAACHGTSGKGDGPAAPALKIPATDLTKLAKNAGGTYPMLHVQEAIRNADTPAHGSKDMPVWGPVFRSMSQGSQGQVELRVNNLAKYVETLQAK